MDPLTANATSGSDIKCQDYVYVKWVYQSNVQKLKYFLKRENKVNENKFLSYFEALRYM